MNIHELDIERYSTPLHHAGFRRQGDLGFMLHATRPQGVDLQTGHPYRTREGRAMIITQGHCDMEIDLHPCRATAGSIVLIVPGALITFNEYSTDYCADLLAFASLPAGCAAAESFALQPCESDRNRLHKYYSLLHDIFSIDPFPKEIAESIFRALLLDFLRLHQADDALQPATLTRRFLHLLSHEGRVKHPIAWYADQLCVSPNHLSNTVKHDSGLTVMQWADRALLQEAKVLLRHSDQPIGDIAFTLGFANPSFFAQFFKRHTGVLPRTYRAGIPNL